MWCLEPFDATKDLQFDCRGPRTFWWRTGELNSFRAKFALEVLLTASEFLQLLAFPLELVARSGEEEGNVWSDALQTVRARRLTYRRTCAHQIHERILEKDAQESLTEVAFSSSEGKGQWRLNSRILLLCMATQQAR